MTSKTHDEWFLAGYRIGKGQKATGRNHAGVATFTKAQVMPLGQRYRGKQVDPDEGADYEEDRDMADAFLHDYDWY